MADTKLSDLTPLAAVAADDLLYVADVSVSLPKSITIADLFASPQPIGGATPATGTFTTLFTTGNASFNGIVVIDSGSSGTIFGIERDNRTNGYLDISFPAQDTTLISLDQYVLKIGANTKLQIDNTSAAGQTALLLYDVDNATVERVSVGIADSGGAGYKVLRILN